MAAMLSAPTTLRAGDSASWVESLPATPATAGWTLKFKFLWASGTAETVTATPSGADYGISLTAAQTADWPAGAATRVAWVEKGAERLTLEQAQVTILPDLGAAANFDGRSQAVKGLADARAALAAYVAAGQLHVAEYDIAGRRMKFRTSKEITDLIDHYEGEVARERAALALLQGQVPGRVHVRF